MKKKKNLKESFSSIILCDLHLFFILLSAGITCQSVIIISVISSNSSHFNNLKDLHKFESFAKQYSLITIHTIPHGYHSNLEKSMQNRAGFLSTM